MANNAQIKKLLLSAATLLSLSGAAFAADLPSKKAPALAPVAVAPAFSWTGCYVGAHIGGDFGHSRWDQQFSPTPVGMSTSGVIAGGQIGCNYQMNQFVVGVEGELWGSTLSGSTLIGGEGFHTSSRIAGDVAIRGGYAIDHTLLFAKVGVAMAKYKYRTDNIGGSNITSFGRATHTGLLLGLGAEYAIDAHWSLKAEYDFITYGRKNASMLVGTSVDNTASIKNTENLFKVGVNYRF